MSFDRIRNELKDEKVVVDVVGDRVGETRRDCLGLLGFTGLSALLSELVISKSSGAESQGRRAAKSCILVWLDGGPSHLDTWDPKPSASAEIRGPFDAIQTCIPGIFLSELFPKLAARLDRCALIRSMTSPLGEHNLGTHYLLTGYQPSPVLRHPAFFSAIQAVDGVQRHSNLPAWIAVPEFKPGGTKSAIQGFLPPQFAPFEIGGNPADPQFQVPYLNTQSQATLDQLRRRHRFRGMIDAGKMHWQPRKNEGPIEHGHARIGDPLTEQAFQLLEDAKVQKTLDLAGEPDDVRRRYGSKTIGQSCLLARRLIEAGVPLVTISDSGWDTHNDLVTRLRDGFTGSKVPQGLGPALDQGLAALMDDLSDRGLLDETLIVVMGEFGRTPRTNASGGRDHWPRVFSVLLAGGPIRGGVVLGSSDRYGESPDEFPVTPADLVATLAKGLGVELDSVLPTPDGRLHRLVSGQGIAIESLLSLA